VMATLLHDPHRRAHALLSGAFARMAMCGAGGKQQEEAQKPGISSHVWRTRSRPFQYLTVVEE
jgi:hypothetical protein